MSTNTNRLDLAVAVLALDEQDTIAATIEQAKRIADGVYVLDCGSRDATAEIAEQLGATVVSTNWPFSFAAARNTLLAEIPLEYRYVLWLNAGETFGHETESLLSQFLKAEAEPDKAYSIMVEVPPVVPDGTPEQVLQLRLFPHRPGIRFVGRVGETATASLRQLGIKQDMAPGRIVCHPRRHTAVWKARRAQRNLHLATLESPDPKNRPARIWRIMGEALCDLGHTAAACEAFREAISSAEKGSTEQLEAYYGLLATMDSDPNLHGRRIAACLEALDVFPLDAQLLCLMGKYLQNADRIDLAVRSYELAVTYGQVDLETWHLQEIAELASVCWALALQLSGEHDKAEAVYRDALERFPNSQRVRRRAAEHFIKQGR
ncbi:MAG: tetratricopeptide repeat protein, partial [Planctomycetota bacterium]